MRAFKPEPELSLSSDKVLRKTRHKRRRISIFSQPFTFFNSAVFHSAFQSVGAFVVISVKIKKTGTVRFLVYLFSSNFLNKLKPKNLEKIHCHHFSSLLTFLLEWMKSLFKWMLRNDHQDSLIAQRSKPVFDWTTELDSKHLNRISKTMNVAPKNEFLKEPKFSLIALSTLPISPFTA